MCIRDRNKAVSVYGLLGLFAGVIFSSCICGTPRNFKVENDSGLMVKIGEFISALYNLVIIILPALFHLTLHSSYTSMLILSFYLTAETSLNNSTIPKTIYNGFLILAIKFVHYLISRGYDKSSSPYTMILPSWVAFTLSVSHMSELSLS